MVAGPVPNELKGELVAVPPVIMLLEPAVLLPGSDQIVLSVNIVAVASILANISMYCPP